MSQQQPISVPNPFFKIKDILDKYRIFSIIKSQEKKKRKKKVRSLAQSPAPSRANFKARTGYPRLHWADFRESPDMEIPQLLNFSGEPLPLLNHTHFEEFPHI